MNGKVKKPRTLADLKPGQRGVVAQVGARALHRHLLDMGITPACPFCSRKPPPWATPEFHLRGYSPPGGGRPKITLEDNGGRTGTGEERGTGRCPNPGLRPPRTIF